MAAWAPTSVQALMDELRVSPEQRDAIAKMEQGSPQWLHSRHGRLTASNFGAAAGHQGKAKQRDLLKQMVWPDTGGLTGFVRRMAQYGTDHEEIARQIYIGDRCRGNALYDEPAKFRIFETGLLVSQTHGWLGASPDFVVEEVVGARPPPELPPVNRYHLHDPYVVEHPEGHYMYLRTLSTPVAPGPEDGVVQGCGEIKCPAAKVKIFYSEKPEHAKYGFPVFYYDQIQGAMAINSWPWCDVVIFTPARTQVTRFYRNEDYWAKTLFPQLKSFYFDMFLPTLEKRLSGLLDHGSVVSAHPIAASMPYNFGVYETPHPEIGDPLLWFARKPVVCTFVIVPDT